MEQNKRFIPQLSLCDEQTKLRCYYLYIFLTLNHSQWRLIIMTTIQDVLDKLIQFGNDFESKVDSLIAGVPYTEVKGIAITFIATHNVLQRAISMGVNLIITHEGVFYSHQDGTGSREYDPVYREKRRLIEESGIAIYRFHDYFHRYKPDGIMVGLIRDLGWNSYVEEHQPTATIVTIPGMTVKEIAEFVKKKLGIPFVRVVGNMSMTCTRIGLLAGYRGGGQIAIPLFENNNLDLIISGEGPEWETPEYVRDAVYQGRQKALIILGHAASEEPGMKYLADFVKTLFPHIPVHFIAEEPLFQIP